MLSNYTFDEKNEKLVTKMVYNAIELTIQEGYNLILDETNLNDKTKKLNIDFIKGVCKKLDKECEIAEIDFDIDLQTAIIRDAGRDFSVGEEVIKRAWKKYILPKKQKELKDRIVQSIFDYKYNNNYKAIIVDIDGTLAINEGQRSYYDYSANVKKDSCNLMLQELLCNIENINIIIVSGREGSDICRQATVEWLDENHIKYDRLFMRSEGDSRSDVIVKKEIYEKYIKPRYNVMCVIDDRKRVLQMWNELGLYTMDVSQDPYAKVNF